jgi:hypothetical protein
VNSTRIDTPRRDGGASPATIARQLGKQPPRNTPVTRRMANKLVPLSASALAPCPSANPSTASVTVDRWPMRPAIAGKTTRPMHWPIRLDEKIGPSSALPRSSERAMSGAKGPRMVWIRPSSR